MMFTDVEATAQQFVVFAYTGAGFWSFYQAKSRRISRNIATIFCVDLDQNRTKEWREGRYSVNNSTKSWRQLRIL